MKITSTEIPEVLVLEPQVHGDRRGYFMETFQRERFAAHGIDLEFVQDNQSGSRQGTLRGLHYQIRQPQGKLVRAVVGEIFDVAVDIRRGSPTFGRWVGTHLSAENRRQMWVPPGFAHGFYVTSDWAELFYKVTDYYAPEWDRTLQWDDPQVGVQWPLLPGVELLLSDKDRKGKPLDEADLFSESG